MPDITVITATIAGREELLEECRASVEAQTLRPKAHIVYLDEGRKGIQHSMNMLWPQVETPWMQWLADDDLLMPEHLYSVSQYTRNADIIHSYCEVTGRDWNPNGSGEDSFWLPATALMRTSLVREVGGWAADDFPEDHHFWVKCNEHGARFAMHRKPTWIYRFRPGTTGAVQNLTFLHGGR